jgi:hypothetical protein
LDRSQSTSSSERGCLPRVSEAFPSSTKPDEGDGKEFGRLLLLVVVAPAAATAAAAAAKHAISRCHPINIIAYDESMRRKRQ